MQLLYQAGLDAVAKARGHLRAGEIRERSRQLSRAMEVLAELSGALDREKGGELALNLALLYDYMSRRLQEANAMQVEPPMIEVERLLNTMLEAWKQCPSAEREVEDRHPVAQAASAGAWAVDDPAVSYSSCSFAG
jgi:flagellar protein FliS